MPLDPNYENKLQQWRSNQFHKLQGLDSQAQRHYAQQIDQQYNDAMSQYHRRFQQERDQDMAQRREAGNASLDMAMALNMGMGLGNPQDQQQAEQPQPMGLQMGANQYDRAVNMGAERQMQDAERLMMAAYQAGDGETFSRIANENPVVARRNGLNIDTSIMANRTPQGLQASNRRGLQGFSPENVQTAVMSMMGGQAPEERPLLEGNSIEAQALNRLSQYRKRAQSGIPLTPDEQANYALLHEQVAPSERKVLGDGRVVTIPGSIPGLPSPQEIMSADAARGLDLTQVGAQQEGGGRPGLLVTTMEDGSTVTDFGPSREQMDSYRTDYDTATRMLQSIQNIVEDPYLPMGTGWTSYGNAMPGTASDFQAKVDQLQGQAFLEAYNSLKGSGQITEVEGRKATEAIARLNTRQSEEGFRKSLSELEEVVSAAQQRARRRMEGTPSSRQRADTVSQDMASRPQDPMGIR